MKFKQNSRSNQTKHTLKNQQICYISIKTEKGKTKEMRETLPSKNEKRDII